MPYRQHMTTDERMAAVETTLDRLVALAEDTDKRTDRIEGLIWRVTGGLAVLIILGQFIIPVVLERLPK